MAGTPERDEHYQFVDVSFFSGKLREQKKVTISVNLGVHGKVTKAVIAKYLTRDYKAMVPEEPIEFQAGNQYTEFVKLIKTDKDNLGVTFGPID